LFLKNYIFLIPLIYCAYFINNNIDHHCNEFFNLLNSQYFILLYFILTTCSPFKLLRLFKALWDGVQA